MEAKQVGNTPFNTKDVLGMASRNSGVIRMVVLERLWKSNIERVCSKNLANIHTVYSDAAYRLKFLKRYGEHKSIAHYLNYADGDIHVNTVESAWALFKRGLIGVFHHVSAKYLQEYLDEFACRWLHRDEKHRLMELVLASC